MLGKEDSYTKVFTNRSRGLYKYQSEQEFLKENQILVGEKIVKNNAEFNIASDTWMEIGFGNGEHLFSQVIGNPEINMIGCEPFTTGALQLCKKIISHDFNDRVSIFHGSAGILMNKLPDNSLNKIFVLFPDPWPKKNQNKRRLISSHFIDESRRLLKTGGELRIASDNHAYITEVHELLNNYSDQWDGNTLIEYKEEWPKTKYLRKAKYIPLALSLQKI